jgi:hypothetical protein
MACAAQVPVSEGRFNFFKAQSTETLDYTFVSHLCMCSV